MRFCGVAVMPEEKCSGIAIEDRMQNLRQLRSLPGNLVALTINTGCRKLSRV
jgi:hypothetical protein